MKEKSTVKKTFRIFTYLVEISLIIITLLPFTQPRSVYSFSVDDMDSAAAIKVPMSEDGWYIDNSMEMTEPTFLKTPKADLEKGSYRMTIRYQTEGGGTTFSLDARNSTYRLIAGRQNITLDCSVSVKEYEFYSYESMKDFFVSFQYDGNGYAWISSVEIERTWAMERLQAFYTLLFIALCELIWFGVRKELFPRLFASDHMCDSLAVACIIGIPVILSSLPCFSYYIINGFDLNFHMLRIEGISESLKNGQFPARIQTNWLKGYGYPVSVFYGDLMLYLPAVLRAIGMPLQNAYKVLLISVNILTGIIMYASAKGITKSRGMAVLASYLYLLLPYRLSCLYIRAGVGEYCAMAFFPLVIWGLYRIYTTESTSKEWRFLWILPSIGFTGIIGSHLLSTVFVGLFTTACCLILFKKTFEKDRLLILLKVVLSTAIINAAYLIPLLDYMRNSYKINATATQARIQSQGAYASQIFSLFPDGSRFSVSISDDIGYANEMVFSLGITAWIGILVFILYLIFSAGKRTLSHTDISHNSERKTVCLFSGTGIAAMILSSTWFPWDKITAQLGTAGSIFTSIQFPWRYLSIASVLLILGGVSALNSAVLQKKAFNGSDMPMPFSHLIFLISLITAVSSAGFLTSRIISDNHSVYIAANCDLDDAKLMGSEYIPEGVDEGTLLSLLEPDAVNTVLTDANSAGKQYIVSVAGTEQNGRISIPKIYYKGYMVKFQESGVRSACYADELGRVCFDIPEGYSGKASVSFCEPWYWRVSELISLLAVLGIAVFLLKKQKIIVSPAAPPQYKSRK